MKKILAVLLSAVMLLSMPLASVYAEEEEIIVTVDGEKVVFDVAPVIVDGRTLVPVRAVFEALGANVEWNADEAKVVSKKGDIEVSLTINEKALVKNGEQIELDVAATITDGRTLVPVRAISEAYGCDVTWNAAKKTVVVISDVNSVEIMNVGGISIPVSYYKVWLDQAANSAATSFGANMSDIISLWETDLGGATLGSQVTAMALGEIKIRKVMQSEAQKQGISLSEEQQKYISDTATAMLNDESMQKSGMSKEVIEMQLADMEYVNMYSEALVKKYDVTTKKIREYLDKNYVRAKHILIMPDAEADGTVTEEARNEAKKLAEEILLKVKRGKDFDMLMREFGEDPGVEQNPGGYLFTKGEMVEPFEKAAFELDINKVSGVVETSYGYHIIKRVKSDYSDEEIATYKEKIVQEEASAEFETIYTAAEASVNQTLVDLILPTAQ